MINNHKIIIAEAGVNHNGDIEIAKRLIKASSKAGADYIKFQTFKADTITIHNAPKAEYQKNNSSDKQKDTKFIKIGSIFNENNINIKRPGSGISPMIWDKVIKKKACKNFQVDDLIEL
jgi:sialic acid synthase SpsE